jgi:hypothetical protein
LTVGGGIIHWGILLRLQNLGVEDSRLFRDLPYLSVSGVIIEVISIRILIHQCPFLLKTDVLSFFVELVGEEVIHICLNLKLFLNL